MKAIVLKRHGAAEKAFEIEDRSDLNPGRGQVRIAVEVSGLNFADVLARQGLYPDAPALLSILGYEAVGRIDAVGEGVAPQRLGERVLAFTRFGGYASQVLTDAAAVVPIPESIGSAAATALATQGCTAWWAAEIMVRLMPGDTVLVHAAAGGVGSLLVQLAKRRGCVVVGTAGSAAKLTKIRELGADHAINYVDRDFASDWPKGVARPDVIFDSIGGTVSKKGLKLLSAGGRLVLFGVADLSSARGPLKALKAAQLLAGFGLPHPISLLSDSKSIIGINMLRIADAHPEKLALCMKEVVTLAARGELKPLVGGVYPVDKIAEAHEKLGSRGTMGKIVLQW